MNKRVRDRVVGASGCTGVFIVVFVMCGEEVSLFGALGLAKQQQ